jgi:murein DD-endopeptidase MepM/ murein hydrolase activator NlpD
MLPVNPSSRFRALALSATVIFMAAGLADPDPVIQPQAASTNPYAPLVPLTREAALTGPRAPDVPAGGSQFVPTGVPPEVRRLAAKVLPGAAPARFPVSGPFNWGQAGARFGAARGGHRHAGQDLFGRTGTPLLAVSDGVVLERASEGGRGNYLALYDPGARRTYVYLHLQRPALAGRGERVHAGQRIGAVGCTGACFGDHLHFEIRRGRSPDGEAIDPRPELERWARSSGARATLPPGAH